MQFSPDGRRLVSAGYGIVRVNDAETGQPIGTIGPIRGGGVEGLALSPDGRRVAIGAEHPNDFELRDAEDGRRLMTFRGHSGRLRSVAWAPDGRRVASASEDRTVRIWDAESGRETTTLRGHAAEVFGVAFSPDGGRIASISWDGVVKLWKVATGGEVRTFRGLVRRPTWEYFGNAIAFRPDGRWLAAASGDGRVVVWDADTGREVHALIGHSRPVTAVAFSPDGRRIASAAGDNTIKLWDVRTGEEVFTLRGHSSGILGLAFSPDGNRIASASADFTVKVWDAASPTPETRRRRRAVALVEPLFRRLLLREDVIARLRSDPTLSSSLREAALASAAGWREDADALNRASRDIVHSAGRSRGIRARAALQQGRLPAGARQRRFPQHAGCRPVPHGAVRGSPVHPDAIEPAQREPPANRPGFPGHGPPPAGADRNQPRNLEPSARGHAGFQGCFNHGEPGFPSRGRTAHPGGRLPRCPRTCSPRKGRAVPAPAATAGGPAENPPLTEGFDVNQLSPEQRELVSSLAKQLGGIRGIAAVVLGGWPARGHAHSRGLDR